MSNLRVKVFTNIPDRKALDTMIADYRASGAEKTGWAPQPDGKYRLEVFFKEESPGTENAFQSPASGQFLFPGE